MCFCLASSWSMMPGGVVGTVKPSWWDRSRLFCHFSRSLRCTSNLGLIPRPCLACLWGSRQFSQPCDHRWFQIRQCNRASSLLETWWGLGWWARPNKDLAFASLLGIVDTLESISQDIHAHHYGGTERWRKELFSTFNLILLVVLFQQYFCIFRSISN